MSKIKVMIRNNQKKIKLPVGLRLLVRKCCQAVLVTEKFEHDAEVSVSFVDNKEIHQLNKLYRNKDRATDVLSFPLGENGVYDINNETGAYLLGDVVISIFGHDEGEWYIVKDINETSTEIKSTFSKLLTSISFILVPSKLTTLSSRINFSSN